ncbi:unnamed protein product [Lactuca saligna]|uniref:Xrn1 helical domain-containing protein n=1 Tax=Lactuca saligna TaxID=75948 RepID=A0AA35YQA4_LACSI|nr:unnamed protein product [Lactuca saligna]
MMVITTLFQVTVIRSSPVQERENTLNLSAHALPPSYQSLMITDDSRILDLYVDDFNVDTDGKRFIWQEEEAKRNAENADNKTVGGRLIASTLVQERSHLSNGSMDDHNRGSGQMMDGSQINIDVISLGAIIALGLMIHPSEDWIQGQIPKVVLNGIKGFIHQKITSTSHQETSDYFSDESRPYTIGLLGIVKMLTVAYTAGHLDFEKLTGGHIEVEKLTVATAAAAGHLEVEKLTMA